MKNGYLFFACFILSTFFLLSCSQKSDLLSFEVMNTFMTIKSYGKNSRKANLLAKEKIMELENLISVTREESDIYRLNHSDGKTVILNEESFYPLSFALEMAGATEGLFNPLLYPVIHEWGFTTGEYKVPEDIRIKDLLSYCDYKKVLLNPKEKSVKIQKDMMIDLGAVGKGYAGDQAIKILKEKGIKSAILDLGGNVQTIGRKIDGKLWSIGIKNPFDSGISLGLKIEDMAVITSGGYERYFEENGKRYIHIFDGRKGFPVENNVASVTIVCKSGLLADSLSTSIFVMGEDEAYNFWKSRSDFEMIIITKDKKLIYTKNLSQNISITASFSAVEVFE